MTIEATSPAPGICLLTLNAPERLNAFSFDMYEQMIVELKRIRHDADTRVVIITGAGRGFCAGHFSGGAGQPSWVDPALGKIPYNARTMSVLSEMPLLLRQLPQPVIAAVNGAAAGVGYSLALSADIAIAASSAKFVNAFHNAGTGHELGLSYLLPRAIGSQRAAELLLTRRAVLAEEAARIGLVLKTVADDALMDEAMALAQSIMMNHPMGIWYTKQSMHYNETASSLAAAIELENRAIHLVQQTGDFAEMRDAMIAKRPVEFRNQ